VGLFALLLILITAPPASGKRFSRLGIPHLAGDYLTKSTNPSRWRPEHRIRIYVSPGRDSFEGIICQCFNDWFRASGGAFNFSFVDSAAQADYIIKWSAHDTADLDATEAGITITDTAPDTVTKKDYIEHAETTIRTAVNGCELGDRQIAETCLHEIGHALGIDDHSPDVRDIMYYAISPKQSGHITQRDSQTIARLYH
jgi:predicted Zn-dependent protease